MSRVIWRVLAILIVLPLVGVLAQANAGWEELPPIAFGTPPSGPQGNEVYQWEVGSDPDGLKAWAQVVIHDPDCESLSGLAIDASATRQIGFHWAGSGAPEPAAFTLEWAGSAALNLCAVTAGELGDFSKATERGYAKVTSGQFEDEDGDLWQVYSQKGAELPANPGQDQESKISTSGTIEVTAGLPPEVTGTLQWHWVILSREGGRSASGEEASQDDVVDSSSTTYYHTGGGYLYNVRASVYHYAEVSSVFQSGGGNCGGIAGIAAMSAKFRIVKGG